MPLHCTLKNGQNKLMPVILAIQDAEIRRIKVRSQPRQIVQETLSGKNTQHNTIKGLV
jgi:hypothetical protein